MLKMQAAIRRKYCSPDEIKVESVDRPTPKSGEVLIKVHATTVNRTDCANLTARPFIMRFVLGVIKPKEIVLGTDFSGEIISKGEKVQSFSVGDKVFGFNDMGAKSQAEYITKTEDQLFRIPENIDFKTAAASLEGAHYAYSFIYRANIQAGQRVLINGATGAIGSALLQFVRQYDVEITATSNTKNIALVKSLGADKVYDYTQEDFTEDNNKYDYIFDAVGKSTFGKCKPLLKEKGVYISSELGPYSQNIIYALLAPMMNKKVFFPIPYSPQESIPFISNLLREGKYKPVIDRIYPLQDIAKAYEYVILGQKTGNVIVEM